MKLFIFARFHAREGQEEALEALLRARLQPVRAAPGCLEMGVYRSVRDPRLFWIRSRWPDEAAFNARRPSCQTTSSKSPHTGDPGPDVPRDSKPGWIFVRP